MLYYIRMFMQKTCIQAVSKKRPAHFLRWMIFVSIFSFLFVPKISHAFPGIITYQGKLTNSSNVTVSDGSYSIKFTLYDAATGGNCLYTASGTCGSTSALTVTVTNGLFSVDLGGSGTNSISSTIFQTNNPYLGVTVSSDSEMTPRKQLTNSIFAYNALYLSGLATSTIGGTSNYIPTTDGSGNLTMTGTPQGTGVNQGVLYLNPASATDEYALLGISVGGVQRFRIDEDGDVFASGTIRGLVTNSSDLGTDGVGFRNIYASSSIRLGTVGSAYTFFADTSTTRVGIASSSPGRSLDVGGGVMFSGDGIFGDSSSDALTVNATSTFNAGITSQAIIPGASNTYDLGSASTLWRNAYVTGTLNVTNVTVTGSCTGCGGAASGWTDGGTNITLTTVSDLVGVGTTTPAAKLHVTSNSDNVAMIVQPNSTQTTDIMRWINAASSSIYARVASDGAFNVSSTFNSVLTNMYGQVFINPNDTAGGGCGVNGLLYVGITAPLPGNGGCDTVAVAIQRNLDGNAQLNIFDDGVGRMNIGFDDDGSLIDGGSFGFITQGDGAGNAPHMYIEGNRVMIKGRNSTGGYYGPPVILSNGGGATSIVDFRADNFSRVNITATDSLRVIFNSNVIDAGGAVGFVFNTTSTITSGTDRALFAVKNNESTRFAISGGGNVYASNSFIANTTSFPGDVAEYVPVSPGEIVEAGDVVMADPQNPWFHTKTNGALGKTVAGVISETGAFIIGNADSGKRMPLAIAGLIYIKATKESGDIQIGDLLVTASEPGKVMKYDSTLHKGMLSIVGMAIEPFNEATGKVLAHVRNSFMGGSTQVSETESGTIIATPSASSLETSLGQANGMWSISDDGKIISESIEIAQLLIRAKDGRETIGEGYFAPGDSEVTVLTTAVTDNSKIFVSFTSNLQGRSHYISAKKAGESFTVRVSTSADDPLVFDWWIIEKKGNTAAISSTQTTQTETVPPVEEITDTQKIVVNEIPVEIATSTENIIQEFNPPVEIIQATSTQIIAEIPAPAPITPVAETPSTE